MEEKIPPRPSRLKRGLAWCTGGLGLALVLAAGAASWLAFSESGARLVLERALALAGGSVAGVQGSLAGPIAIESIELAAGGTRVKVTRLTLDWQPTSLLLGELHVTKLHAAALEIESEPSGDPVKEPSKLSPPFAIRVTQAGLDRLVLATRGEAKPVELQDLALKLAGDRTAWIVGDARAKTPFGLAQASGTLGASSPYALDARGALEGLRGERKYGITLSAKGPLAGFEAAFDGTEGGLEGGGRARIAPFEAAPLRALFVKLAGLDLSAFANAPQTRLAVEANLAPSGELLLAGPVKIANAAPGPLDRNQVPVASLAGRLSIAKDGGTKARDVEAAFTGGGTAKGNLAWAKGKLEAALDVRGLDLLAWHTKIRATSLSGSLRAEATQEAQSFTLDLADPRFTVAGAARFVKDTLEVERVRIARAGSAIEAAGTLGLKGRRAFTLEGRLDRVNPGSFAKVPEGEISGGLKASGNLGEGWTIQAAVEIARSRFAGLALEGRADVAADAKHLGRIEADFAMGETRASASGAFGRAGDALAGEARLARPRAPGQGLGPQDRGARRGRRARRGHLGRALRPRHVQGRQSRAAERDAAGLARCEAGRGHGRGFAAHGRRDARRAARVPGEGAPRHEGRPHAAGHAGGPRPAPRRRPGRELAGPPPAFGRRRRPFERAARMARPCRGARVHRTLPRHPRCADHAHDRRQPGRAGRGAARRRLGQPRPRRHALDAHCVRDEGRRARHRDPDRDAPRGIARAPSSNLVVGGTWDLRAAETIEGFAELKRESGDVRVGEARQALGLETLLLRVDAAGGRVKAKGEIRGAQVGKWLAEGEASLRRAEGGWEVSPVAPIAGHLEVDVPDLAWTAGWLGPDAQAGGRLAGRVSLTGTQREPTWEGRIDGTGLVIRDPASGFEGKEGTLALSFKDHELRVEKLAFDSPWRPNADAAKALAGVKRPDRGSISAEGALDFATRKGEIRVKSAAYPVTQLATRFLAVSGEAKAELDGTTINLTGDLRADAGWFGIPASAAPSVADDVIVERGEPAADATPSERIRLDLRVALGDHTHFTGRGLNTRLAGSIRLAGDVGSGLRATGSIRAVEGTYDAYGQKLAIERGALNFQGPLDNPGLNVLALRKGLPVEAGVEILGNVARPRVRLVSQPDVPDPEKLAWLVLGRGQGQVSASDATLLVAAAGSILGRDDTRAGKLLDGLGFSADDIRLGQDSGGLLGTMPQSTVAGKMGTNTTQDVLSVGKRLSDTVYLSYRQGLAETEGSMRVAWQVTKSFQLILRAGYQTGLDGVYRFTLDDAPVKRRKPTGDDSRP